MTQPYNQKAINNFVAHKTKYDKVVACLQLMSDVDFGLKPHQISHQHCGELLFIIASLEEIIANMSFKLPTPL